jgi:Ca-activated chloride channel homolog
MSAKSPKLWKKFPAARDFGRNKFSANIMKIIVKLSLLFIAFSTVNFGQTENTAEKQNQVLLNVSVVLGYNEPIPNLKVENFRLFENGKPLQISYFSNEDVAISVGFLIDNSNSMGESTDFSREGIVAFLNESNPDNEYFVTAFNKKIEVLSEFINHDETEKLISDNPYFVKFPKNGKTVLYDAMVSGIEKLSKSKNQKRVLFVFWDVNEEYTIGSYKKVEKLLKEKNVILYSIGCGEQSRLITSSIEDLAEVTGGRTTYPENRLSVSKVKIFDSYKSYFREQYTLTLSDFAKQLRHQYTIGFNPNLEGDENRWRNLEIKLELEKELQKELKKKSKVIKVLHRRGYYPSSEIVASN